MDDLISRRDAIDAFHCTDELIVCGVANAKNMVNYINKVIGKIESLPSVQSEIIRCKDCKHYYYADNRIPQEQRYSCYLDGDRWMPDSYCSFAERRDNG